MGDRIVRHRADTAATIAASRAARLKRRAAPIVEVVASATVEEGVLRLTPIRKRA